LRRGLINHCRFPVVSRASSPRSRAGCPRHIEILVLCVLALCLPVAAAENGQKLLGDESDGSRAHPIHRIELLAEPGEEGAEPVKIDPDIDTAEEVLLPFSTRRTCGECHSYGIIKKGWHFNSVDPNAESGRPGQPWIYVDAKTGTQILLSYRSWPGTFKPGQFGLTDPEFTKIFGRQTPGGGAGETDDEVEVMRQYVSGKLEINCLSCHNGDPRQDQGGTTGYAVQTSRGNFRWATAASSGLAAVTGLILFRSNRHKEEPGSRRPSHITRTYLTTITTCSLIS